MGAAIIGILIASIEPILAWWQERPPSLWGVSAFFIVSAVVTWLYVRALRHGRSEVLENIPLTDSRLEIKEAVWANGDKSKYSKVKTFVNSAPHVIRTRVLAANESLGGLERDPAPSEEKWLTVDYSYDGGPTKTAIRPQSHVLILPEDPWLLEQIESLKTQLSDAEKLCFDNAPQLFLRFESGNFLLKNTSVHAATNIAFEPLESGEEMLHLDPIGVLYPGQEVFVKARVLEKTGFSSTPDYAPFFGGIDGGEIDAFRSVTFDLKLRYSNSSGSFSYERVFEGKTCFAYLPDKATEPITFNPLPIQYRKASEG